MRTWWRRPPGLGLQIESPEETYFRTGLAAIVAGTFIFLGHTGELAFGTPSDAVGAVYITLVAIGFGALALAIWRLGPLLETRLGRIGWRIAAAGVVLLGLFVVQLAITAALTGDIPDNFVLFGLGFLLVFIGQLLFAPDLRNRLGRAWLLPLVAAAGLVVALVVDVDPIHDIGLLVFEGAWVALSVALVRTPAASR